MKSLIPEFKPGDRVMVRPQPLEQRCSICKRHYGCVELLNADHVGIVATTEYKLLTCHCCDGDGYSMQGMVAYHKPTELQLFAAPYTWLTPLGESHG